MTTNPAIVLQGGCLWADFLPKCGWIGILVSSVISFHGLPNMSTAPSPRIFIVEDEEVISATLAAILRRSGFEVAAFTDPLECLAAAFHGQPELLVSDVMMPGLSGIELAVQIQQVCPDCRIL